MSSDARIALSGYYGCGNTGDEAVLAGIVESFARRGHAGRVSFTVLSADPADTQARHGLQAVDRMSRAALRRALRESDLLISGGGSLLQDTTSLRSLVYYLAVVVMARTARVPVMFYAQGMGPLSRPAARAMVRVVANRVQRITVRDQGSASLLARIGVRRPPVEVTADPAFALSPAPPDEVAGLLAEAGAPPGVPLIGVALRPWQAPALPVEDYAAAVRAVCEKLGGHAVFLPMQPPGDRVLSEAVAAGLGDLATVVARPLSPRQALGLTGRMQGLLAMRLHTLIFAAAQGVPSVALAYDPKVGELMAQAGQAARTVPLDRFAPDDAASMLVDAVRQGDGLRATLCARAEELRERALANVDLAMTLVDLDRNG